MKSIVIRNNERSSVTEISVKPITLEQFCEIFEYTLQSEKTKNIWACKIKHNETIVFSSDSFNTQLKAMNQLCHKINESNIYRIKVFLGRKGWIDRS